MRKKQARKRPIFPDPKFNDQLVTRFVNNLMLHGKKSTAYNLFYDAIEIVEKRKQNEEKTAIHQLYKAGKLKVINDHEEPGMEPADYFDEHFIIDD